MVNLTNAYHAAGTNYNQRSHDQSLTAIYHARIDYPGFNPPHITGPLPPLPSTALDSEERVISYTKPSEVPSVRAAKLKMKR